MRGKRGRGGPTGSVPGWPSWWVKRDISVDIAICLFRRAKNVAPTARQAAARAPIGLGQSELQCKERTPESLVAKRATPLSNSPTLQVFLAAPPYLHSPQHRTHRSTLPQVRP